MFIKRINIHVYGMLQASKNNITAQIFKVFLLKKKIFKVLNVADDFYFTRRKILNLVEKPGITFIE